MLVDCILGVELVDDEDENKTKAIDRRVGF